MQAVQVLGVQGLVLTETEHRVCTLELTHQVTVQELLAGPRPRAFTQLRQQVALGPGGEPRWALPATDDAFAWAEQQLKGPHAGQLRRMVELHYGSWNGVMAAARSTLGCTLKNQAEFRSLPPDDLWRLLAARASDRAGWHKVLCRYGPFCDLEGLRRAAHQLLRRLPSVDGTERYAALAQRPERHERIDVLLPAMRQRLVLSGKDGRWTVLQLISPDGRRNELEIVQPDRARVRHFSDAAHLRRWLDRLLRSCRHERWPPGTMMNFTDGMTSAAHGHAALSPLVGLRPVALPELGMLPAERQLATHHLPPSSDQDNTITLRSAFTHTEQTLRRRAVELGVDPDQDELDLTEAIASRASERAPALSLCADGYGVFVRRARGTFNLAAGDLAAVESLLCHALSRTFVHAGLPARPHRLTGTLHTLQTFVPLNPFAGAGRAGDAGRV